MNGGARAGALLPTSFRRNVGGRISVHVVALLSEFYFHDGPTD